MKRLAILASLLAAVTVLCVVLLSGHGPGLQGEFVHIPGGHCQHPTITVWAGFRAHVLIPHEDVGTIIDDQPRGQGMTRQGNTYYWHGRPFLRVVHHTHPGWVRVVATALSDLWIQEPGLAVKIAGDGTWQGFGPRWSTDRYAVRQRNAYLSTIHFSRAHTGPRYVQTVKYREGDKCLTLYSDGGFERLLHHPVRSVPWQGALVMGGPYRVVGVYTNPNEALRRWELAGLPPNVSQMYFFGWTGGPGAITNAAGRTPVPGTQAGGDYNLLYNPPAWRELHPHQQIAESLYVSAS